MKKVDKAIRYQIVYSPPVNERIVKTKNIGKFLRSFNSGGIVYSVVNLTTFERIQ